MADKYIAKQTLFVGTAAAHQPGDEVPLANVERNDWAEGVAKVGTKAAEEVETLEQSRMAAAQVPAPK